MKHTALNTYWKQAWSSLVNFHFDIINSLFWLNQYYLLYYQYLLILFKNEIDGNTKDANILGNTNSFKSSLCYCNKVQRTVEHYCITIVYADEL